jgi:hypothetical protein
MHVSVNYAIMLVFSDVRNSTFALGGGGRGGGSHWSRSAKGPKFMVWLYRSHNPSGEEGVNFLVQMLSTCFRHAQRKGGSAPCEVCTIAHTYNIHAESVF